MRGWIHSDDAIEVIARMSIKEKIEVEVGAGVWVIEKVSNELIKTKYYTDIVDLWKEKQEEE